MAEGNNDRRTNVTAATRGGMSFDQLCRGEAPYYVCDRECLVDITHRDTLETAEKKLVEKIEKLFLEIQIQKDVRINKFYIGKTYIRKTANAKKLDKFNPKTWRKEEISSRWSDHKANDYGKDGMIVIAVITKEQVPQTKEGKPAVVDQEQYTLALEQRLLHYYKITKGDVRLVNKTFTSGTDKEGSAGYALYVAFSCIASSNDTIHSSMSTPSLQITPPTTNNQCVTIIQPPIHVPVSDRHSDDEEMDISESAGDKDNYEDIVFMGYSSVNRKHKKSSHSRKKNKKPAL